VRRFISVLINVQINALINGLIHVAARFGAVAQLVKTLTLIEPTTHSPISRIDKRETRGCDQRSPTVAAGLQSLRIMRHLSRSARRRQPLRSAMLQPSAWRRCVQLAIERRLRSGQIQRSLVGSVLLRQ